MNPDAHTRVMATDSCRAGFTVLELVVTIGILAVLSTLLLPALAGARQRANRARCSGQLRQFGLASQMYWDDHEGLAFRYRREATNNGDLYWFGWLEQGEEGERRFDPAQGALWPYLQARGIAICPALRTTAPEFKPKAAGGAGGYGYNLFLSAPLSEPAFRVSTLTRPSEVAVFADAAQVNDFQPPASPGRPMIEEFYYINTTEPTAHFRHALKANVVFSDGHVATGKPVPGSLDSRLLSAGLGRLSPGILIE
jgi:prepilin-type processing-associated H-X9-DG protein/prepilin-type N-terminal cleavage/methylation domain-containing protein